jgi:alginate O-acetyltransferase complex protein AlgI
MIFNTLDYYFLFLIPAALLYRASALQWRPWVCAIFGAAFFVYFSLKEAGGVAGAACLLILCWECLLSRFYKRGSILCLVGLVQGILILFVFKYWNFTTGLFYPPNQNALRWTGAFLPLGISFFTFEFIHYAVESYRGKITGGLSREYFAFILFFPTMVAGPIKRYQNFTPELTHVGGEWTVDWNRGITRILAGLAKKFAIADVLSAFTDHLNSKDLLTAHRWVLPLWLLAFGIKLYIDFSAYSDIAIGSARLFGIRVPENFDWPYGRTNISEFWRRWHISLTNWLFDYIFAPLCKKGLGRFRAYASLFITMLIAGVWHGAGWNFIVFGALHGLMLVTYQIWRRFSGRTKRTPGRLQTTAAAGFTFCCVILSFAFFAMDLPTASLFFRRLLWG